MSKYNKKSCDELIIEEALKTGESAGFEKSAEVLQKAINKEKEKGKYSSSGLKNKIKADKLLREKKITDAQIEEIKRVSKSKNCST